MIAELLPRVGTFLGDVGSMEGRFLVTLGILFVTALFGWLLVPRGIRMGERVVADWVDRLLDGRAEESLRTVSETLPISFTLRLLVGVVQLAVVGLATVAVLTVWGQYSVVVAVLPLAESALSVGLRLLFTAGILTVTYVAVGLLREFVQEFSAGTDRVTAHQEQLLTRIMQVTVLVVAGITTLGVWGVNLSGLLVGAGFVGIVLGMAARQTLGSLIAGFVLMFSRPFEIGDWVQIGDEEGFITDITIMNTHLRNFDGEYVVVPNDNVTNDAITNRTREGRLRIHLEVGIDYGDDPERASELAREVLDDVESIANQPPPHVVPSGFGDSAILLDVRFWIDPPTPQLRWRSKAAAINGIQRRFAAAGIDIPFPQRTVSRRPTDPASERANDSAPEVSPDPHRPPRSAGGSPE